MMHLHGGPTLETAGSRSAAAHWRGGIFYVNPEDPELCVNKRFGIGYTLNFGRPEAWVLLGLILLIPLIPLGLCLLIAPR
jgi:uncharacterized membrane protein